MSLACSAVKYYLGWAAVQEQIGGMRASGGTSFSSAFAKIKDVLFGDTSGGKVRAQAFEVGTAAFEAQRQLGRQGLLVQGAPAFVRQTPTLVSPAH